MVGGGGVGVVCFCAVPRPLFLKTPKFHRSNYTDYKRKTFDIVINANGNSKRYWANRHPLEDFMASTVSVYQSIFDFPCGTYIYISSPDVYTHHESTRMTRETVAIDPKALEPYGLHKYLSELIVMKYAKKFLILRCSMMLGMKLTKGPFFDVQQSMPLFVTTNSRLQLITTRTVADILESLLQSGVRNDVINIGGLGTFSFTKIQDYFDQNIRSSPQAKQQIYEMNITKLKRLYSALKTSEEYLQEFVV